MNTDWPISESNRIVIKARERLKAMSDSEKIDLMVLAGIMTEEQALKAKTNLSEPIAISTCGLSQPNK